MLVTSSWIIDFLLLFTITTFLLYKYSTRKFDYWKKRGVFGPKPLPFFGNFADICFLKISIGHWLKKIYDNTDHPYFGVFIFDEPHLILKSPEVIKQILVKDFSHFTDRSVAAPKHNELLSNLMFFQKSPEWKLARSKLTPVFTSGKLKGMFPLVDRIGHDLTKYIQGHLGMLEGKEICAKYSTDVTAKCFFGINSHSFDEKESTFRKLGRFMFDFRLKTAFVQTAYFFRPKWVQLFHLNFVDKWIMDYFSNVTRDVMNKRGKNKDGKLNDLIDILNDMQQIKEICRDFEIDGDKIVAHAIQLFIAGFETTSATISFTLYECCISQHIQNKLRNEIINTIKEHQGLTYESLNHMTYMEMCVKETLRKYPVLPFLDRICNTDYKIPGTNLVIEKGIPVYVPMFGLHLDEKYFPESQKYDPERFRNKNSNSDGLVYMPFGEGPRMCVGERFGLMSTKIALAHILSKFEIEKNSNTPDPIEFEARSFLLQSKVGLPMTFKQLVPKPA